MASVGPNNPGTAVVDTGVGTQTWINPNNVFTSNGGYAWTWTDITATSQYLKVTNFGFSIPSGATINGIVVEIERFAGLNDTRFVKDNRVRIVKEGTIQTTDLADTTNKWPTTDTYKTYGTSSELWGTTWTDTDINNSGFGIAISTNTTTSSKVGIMSLVDHIRITVHYTVGSSNTSRNQVIII